MNIIIDKDGNLYVNDIQDTGDRLAACIENPADGDTIVYDGTAGIWKVGKSASGLPAVTADDNGDVLTVVEGAWAKAAPSGGGSVLVVHEVEGTLDKTWKEIHDALANGTIVVLPQSGTNAYMSIVSEASVEEGTYSVFVFDSTTFSFTTDSENGYPVMSDPK